MEIIIADSYEDISALATTDLFDWMNERQSPLLCVASGHSPSGIYREIVNRVKNNQLDISGWSFVGLDEWMEMNSGDEGSCGFSLHEELFKPLGVPEHKIRLFNGRAKNQKEEIEQVEQFIRDRGGIDVAILGLGLNGHIGMNEPGTPVNSRAHISELHPMTKEVGQKYFRDKRDLSKGLTLGLANLLGSKHVMLMVNGAHKAAIVKEIMNTEISEQLPASLLRNHSSARIYLDKQAAQLIENTK